MTSSWYIEPLPLPNPTLDFPKIKWWDAIWAFSSRQDPAQLLQEGYVLLKQEPIDIIFLHEQCFRFNQIAEKYDKWSSFSKEVHFWVLSGLLWQHLAAKAWQTLAGHPPPNRIIEIKHRRLAGCLRWTTESIHPWHKTNEKALHALQRAYHNFHRALSYIPEDTESIVWKSPESQERQNKILLRQWLKNSENSCFTSICRCPWKEEEDLQWCRTTRPGDTLSELEYIEYLSQIKPFCKKQDLHFLYEREHHILEILKTIKENSSQKKQLQQRTSNRLILIESLIDIRNLKKRSKKIKTQAKEKTKKDSFFARLLFGRKLYQKRLGLMLSPLIPDICRCLSKLPNTKKSIASLNEDLISTIKLESESLWRDLKKWQKLPLIKSELSYSTVKELKPCPTNRKRSYFFRSSNQ